MYIQFLILWRLGKENEYCIFNYWCWRKNLAETISAVNELYMQLISFDWEVE